MDTGVAALLLIVWITVSVSPKHQVAGAVLKVLFGEPDKFATTIEGWTRRTFCSTPHYGLCFQIDCYEAPPGKDYKYRISREKVLIGSGMASARKVPCVYKGNTPKEGKCSRRIPDTPVVGTLLMDNCRKIEKIAVLHASIAAELSDGSVETCGPEGCGVERLAKNEYSIQWKEITD